jgi:hypothetical protein
MDCKLPEISFKVPKETKLAQNLSEVFEFIAFGTLTDITV